MDQQLFIVTGSSRGLGAALVDQLLAPGHTVLGLARHTSADLTALAQRRGATLIQWPCDLSDGAGAAQRLGEWLAQHDPQRFAQATLINNAATIAGIAPLRQAHAADLVQALRVGLEAPLLLCSAFLQASTGWRAQRRVLNVSSGLGRRAMASQAAYCAVKAGMDHFTRCLALEEAAHSHGAKVCSLAPGVIDTDMQAQLREASRGSFPDQPSFAALHTNGQLSSPQDTARQVLAYLARADFGTNAVADVRG